MFIFIMAQTTILSEPANLVISLGNIIPSPADLGRNPFIINGAIEYLCSVGCFVIS